MKQQKDYVKDIAEIRSMMERSSKFLSLSGWAGILVGIYALLGSYIARYIFSFNPDEIVYSTSPGFWKVAFVAIAVFVVALVTAVALSYGNATKRGEKLWTATSRQLAISMAVPLIAGALLSFVLISKDMIGLIAPITLLFYGLALFDASKFTYTVVKVLGLVEIVLGLLAACFIEHALLLWALGFGVAHIIYGIYVYYRYER
jgi:hypothetical protein